MPDNTINYGKNLKTNQNILLDRTKMASPAQLIIGKTNKNFVVTKEISSVLSQNNNTQIIILDPTGEYKLFAHQHNGIVLTLTEMSSENINIFDDTFNDNENFMVTNIDFFLIIYELLIERMLTPQEKSAISKVLQKSKVNNINEFILNLKDLIKTPSDFLITNNFPMLNSPTNRNVNSKLVVYDISQCSSKYKNLMYLLCLKDIWKQTVINNKNNVYTWCYFDNLNGYLENEHFSFLFSTILKRARMHRGVYTCITDNLNIMKKYDNLTILMHTPFVIVLDAPIENKQNIKLFYNLTKEEDDYLSLTQSQGLMIINSKKIPFKYRQ